MSYAKLATITAWLLAINLALACLAALALHLELGIGPSSDLLDADSYSRLFTLHGAFGLGAVLRPGLLAPLCFAHVARSRPDGGRGLGLWPAGMGTLALLFALGLIVLMASGVVSDAAHVRDLGRGMFSLLSIADIGVGLGVLLGLAGIEAPRRSMLDWIVGAVALTEVALASVVLLMIGQGSVFISRFELGLELALLVGLAVSSAAAKPRARGSARVAVALLLATAIFDVVGRVVVLRPDTPFTMLRLPIIVAAQLAAMRALLNSGARGPTRDVVLTLGLLLIPAMLLRLYLDTLSVDVHLGDTYMAVADFHFDVLLVIAIGGPFALRHHCPQRYERWPSWLVRAVPWVSGGALLWFSLALGWLGHQGMPRRYYAFLPEFLIGHRLAAVAATLLCLAMLAEAVLWIRGRAPAR